jgi:hypothetical protein
MHQFLPSFLLIFLGWTLVSPAHAEDPSVGVDLLYPEFAHPQEDARAAIGRNDLRFITTDRHHTVPAWRVTPDWSLPRARNSSDNVSVFSRLAHRISALTFVRALTPPTITVRSCVTFWRSGPRRRLAENRASTVNPDLCSKPVGKCPPIFKLAGPAAAQKAPEDEGDQAVKVAAERFASCTVD